MISSNWDYSPSKQALRVREPIPDRVVILRALQLGDLLCTVPALRALRSALPESEVTLVGLPWALAFVERFNKYVDRFVEFPGYPGLPEHTPQIERIPGFLQEMQAQQYDLALQMQGSGYITNPLITLFGARNSAGFTLPGQYCADETRYLPYPVGEPELIRHLALMQHLGIGSEGAELEFPITPEDLAEYESFPETSYLEPGRFICIHPGARAAERRWPLARFAEVADELDERGFQVVITGSSEETGLAEMLAGKMRATPIQLAGRTSLGALAVLISRARMIICNDTGVSHIADALHTPSIILFTYSDPNRWAPLDKQLHREITWAMAAPAQAVLLDVEELLREENHTYAG